MRKVSTKKDRKSSIDQETAIRTGEKRTTGGLAEERKTVDQRKEGRTDAAVHLGRRKKENQTQERKKGA